MRRAEITNLKSELRGRLAELDRQREVTAEFSPIGMGRLRVLAAPEGAAPAETTINVTPEPDPEPADELIDGFPEPPRAFRR
jgi:hypothetical protein